MDKTTKRKIMNAISQMNLNDEDVHIFIRNLAQQQLYKSPRTYLQFCTDCAIFYTSSIYTMSRWKGEVESYHQWSEDFVNKAEAV